MLLAWIIEKLNLYLTMAAAASYYYRFHCSRENSCIMSARCNYKFCFIPSATEQYDATWERDEAIFASNCCAVLFFSAPYIRTERAQQLKLKCYVFLEIELAVM